MGILSYRDPITPECVCLVRNAVPDGSLLIPIGSLPWHPHRLIPAKPTHNIPDYRFGIDLSCAMPGRPSGEQVNHSRRRRRAYHKRVRLVRCPRCLNPVRTAVPFWGQAGQIPRILSQKPDFSAKRVNIDAGSYSGRWGCCWLVCVGTLPFSTTRLGFFF